MISFYIIIINLHIFEIYRKGGVRMNVWWYVMIACIMAVVGVIVVFLSVSEEKYKKLSKFLGYVFFASLIGVLAALLIASSVDDSRTSRANRADLQSLGFRVVDMEFKDDARVSLPRLPIGCRITLKQQGKDWYATIAGVKDDSPVINAWYTAARPSVKRWCGPLQK